MLSSLFNWRNILGFMAILIVVSSIFLSQFLSKKIASEEKQKIEQWVEAVKELSNINSSPGILVSKVLTENRVDIPMIAVTEKDSIFDHSSLDSIRIANDKNYLNEKLQEFKSKNAPILWTNPLNPKEVNKVYYGDSNLLKQIKYFPIVQLVVVALFIIIILYAVSTRNRSTQNQVWAGMAKETAHQLGTPISSLQGWVEMLKDDEKTFKIGGEISKDVDRLKLVSDRFGKIGSIPQLEETDLTPQIQSMMDYIKRRAPGSVAFELVAPEDAIANINPPLFDWVIENLLKNALDAMDGKGEIKVSISNEPAAVTIDVKDSGKGISRKNLKKVFKPGFTTKKRGWGLGLSLSQRIINQYHKGELFVKQSDPTNGTTFRIILKK